MKKFTKVCLITALILVVISVGCFAVGGILGASPVWVVDNAFQFGMTQAEQYGKNFDKNFDMKDFTLEGEYQADDIKSLSINMDMGAAVLRMVDSDTCKVWVDEGTYTDYVEIAEKGGTLEIEEVSLHKNSFTFTDLTLFMYKKNWKNAGARIIIELPEKMYHMINANIQMGAMKLYDTMFTEMYVNVEAGSVYSEGRMDGSYARITVDMGAASIEDIDCSKVLVNVSMGSLQIDSVKADTLETNVDMGDAKLKQTQVGNLTVDCEMGNVDLELVGNPKDYYISYDADMGDVDIDGSVSKNAQTARYTADLSCDMGDIAVHFIDYRE